MTEAAVLRGFVMDCLRELGGEVSERDGLAWVQLPESARAVLDAPPSFCLTFDPDRAGQFGAELVAPGSYSLERILSAAMRRGRWDSGRLEAYSDEWVTAALQEAGIVLSDEIRWVVQKEREALLFLFTFRVTMISDEKRESFHAVLVPEGGPKGWIVSDEIMEAHLRAWTISGVPPGLDVAYEAAQETLRSTVRDDLEAFRKHSLEMLEEEVRRIFGYFDRTVQELRDSSPTGVEDLVRAVVAERDRRLAEALERYDAQASAALCGVRVVRAPVAEGILFLKGKATTDLPIQIDAWSKTVRGLRCSRCGREDGPWMVTEREGIRCTDCVLREDGSARPRARPRSDTPPRRRKAAQGEGRSPRESTAQSRAAAGRRRSP